MQKRVYTGTDINLSVVGFGGILVRDETPADAARIVGKAIDADINYFDVAPSYGDAEEKLGPALEPYRKSVFLACKTEQRTAGEARKALENSLKLLKTDYFDLFQFHSVTTDADVDTILGPGGALETFVAARKQGLVRYLGFSAHSESAALRLMAAHEFRSILFPVNWVTWHKGGFGERVVKAAKDHGMAILALKSLAKRKWLDGEERSWPKAWYKPVETYEEALNNLRFTLSKPVTAAVSPGHEQFLDWAIRAEKELTPMTAAEETALMETALNLEPVFSV